MNRITRKLAQKSLEVIRKKGYLTGGSDLNNTFDWNIIVTYVNDLQNKAPKTYYLWRNGLWNDTLQLDDALFELFNEQEKSYDRVEEQVANAYDNSVDKVELDYDEFIAHLKDYNFNKRGY